jgi:hypothetical protein
LKAEPFAVGSGGLQAVVQCAQRLQPLLDRVDGVDRRWLDSWLDGG